MRCFSPHFFVFVACNLLHEIGNRNVQLVARYEGKDLTDFKYNIFLFRTKIRFSHNRYYNIFMRSTAIRIRNHEARTEVKSFVHQNARHEGIENHVSGLNHSCNKLHATFEMNNALDG